VKEVERLLLLALALLVSRQQALAAGVPEPLTLAALRQPILFPFAFDRGAYRARIPQHLLEAFQGSLLVAEAADFVAPVSSLGPQLRLVRTDAEAGFEAKLSAALAGRLCLGEAVAAQACYSPLQVLFSDSIGYYLPGRHTWHGYLGSALAQRVGGRVSQSAARTEVSWEQGSFAAADAALGQRFEYHALDLRFELEVRTSSFELQARAESPGALFQALRDFCLASPLPAGVVAASQDQRSLRIAGGE
jgi:hypothetical protein